MPGMISLDIETARKRKFDLIELKIDGSRHTYDGKNLFSDRKIIRNSRFPQIYEEVKKLNWSVRGEIAIPGGNVLELNKRENWPFAAFYIFDIFEFESVKMDFKITQKRKIIESILNSNRFEYLNIPLKFDSFDEGWKYVCKHNREGLVLKENSGICWKIKRYIEEKVPIVGYLEGKSHGSFFINRNGIVSKISATSMKFLGQYFILLNEGKTPYAEIEYLFLTSKGTPFQPKLRRIFTMK